MKHEYEDFGQIGRIYFAKAIPLDPKPMKVAELAAPGARAVLFRDTTHRHFERIDWHPCGVRLWLPGKPPVIVPIDKIDSIVMASPEKLAEIEKAKAKQASSKKTK